MITIADLPDDAKDPTWFYGLLKVGESGLDLARRVERVPEDLDVDEVFRWTRLSGGKRGVVLLAARYRGEPHAYSFQEG